MHYFVILLQKCKNQANKYQPDGFMNLFDIILLAIALAMDCFSVSVVSGVIERDEGESHSLRMAFLFGFFQAMMPLLGFVGISYFAERLAAVDHWIAFGLLAFIGGKMIKDALGPEEELHFNPRRLSTQLLLAVATSIDALAVGISFACTGYPQPSQLSLPLLIIGVVSFLFSIIGFLSGRHFGKKISRQMKPELLGGLILIAIGVKILITHLAE